MLRTIKESVLIRFVIMFIVVDLLAMSVVHAKGFNSVLMNWQRTAAPIKVVDVTPDGKYPIYELEGAATDITYKSGNKLYTSGDLVGRLVFLEPEDAKGKQYRCEFICKDKLGRPVGINPSFKFLIKEKK